MGVGVKGEGRGVIPGVGKGEEKEEREKRKRERKGKKGNGQRTPFLPLAHSLIHSTAGVMTPVFKDTETS